MKTRALYGILLGAMTAQGFAAESGIFTWRLGSFEVYMLMENQRQSQPSILIGASEAQLRQYLPGGTYLAQTNTFLIRGGGHTVLVDTGFGGALFTHLQSLGIKAEDVDTVLITHMHGDHIGGLARDGKALFPRAKVYLARQEEEYWIKTQANSGAITALAPYQGRIETFLPGELGGRAVEILSGISAVAAFGHTPGHTAFLVESGGKQFLIWGDLMHVMDIQFPLPGISVTYDTDPAAAAAIRTRILDWAAKNNVTIGGMHLASPAVGTVGVQGSGFRFIPAAAP